MQHASTQFIVRGNTNHSSAGRGKVIAMSLVAVINGALYFNIAIEGGQNFLALFNTDAQSLESIIYPLSVGSCLVYSMFTYKTLESLSLRINTLGKAAFSLLAPFSAAAFLTAGKQGAELLQFNSHAALAIGVSLFALRMVNCVDASVKFPNRLAETKQTFIQAVQTKDIRELARLTVVWLASLGYVLCTTDAIYHATEIILGWAGIANQDILKPVCYTASALGAIGTLPLNVYWSHRGLRQLTFGGKKDAEGNSADPTDRYTFIGLVLVTPVILGVLGGATAAGGAVFGQLGTSAQVLRVVTSILYAVFAGTPGMASLLRGSSHYIKNVACCKKETDETRSLLKEGAAHDNDMDAGNVNTSNKSFWFNMFRKSRQQPVSGTQDVEAAKHRDYHTFSATTETAQPYSRNNASINKHNK